MKLRTLLSAAAGSAMLPKLDPARYRRPTSPIAWICPYATRQGPELCASMAAHGNVVAGGTPEQFGAFVKSEAPHWGKVVRDAKTVPE